VSSRRPLLASIAAIAAAAIALGLASPAPAAASPTIWALARSPSLAQREALLAEAESLLIKYRQAGRLRIGDSAATIAKLYLRRTRELLEQAGAATSADPLVRYELGEVTHLLGDDAVAQKLLESVVHAEGAPAPILAEAYSQLAEAYTRVGRYEDEIKAYDKALTFEPHALARARLLANRAESYMTLGDLGPAIDGYRSALSLLTTLGEMARMGPTTLWGLGVALDRSGDLEGGLESIRIARTYDSLDHEINGEGWFYVPTYDRYWYQAIGHWSAARHAELKAARAERYGRAIDNWQEYIDRAPSGDRWALIARARLKQCEKERDERIKRPPGSLPAKAEPAKRAAPPKK
jgi:tetratricopeptide (TPR) repeat protein